MQATVLCSTNLLITLTVLTIIKAIGVGETRWRYAAFEEASRPKASVPA